MQNEAHAHAHTARESQGPRHAAINSSFPPAEGKGQKHKERFTALTEKTDISTCLLTEVSLTEVKPVTMTQGVRRKKNQEVIGWLPRDREGSVAGGTEPCCRNPPDQRKGEESITHLKSELA